MWLAILLGLSSVRSWSMLKILLLVLQIEGFSVISAFSLFVVLSFLFCFVYAKEKESKLKYQQQVLFELLRNTRFAEHLIDTRHCKNSQVDGSVVVQGRKVEDGGQQPLVDV